MKPLSIPIIALAMALPFPSYAGQKTQSLYREVARLPLQGDDRWDYLAVDAGAHRLYVTRATHVSVFDTTDNTLVGDIPDTQGVHGVALAPTLRKAFTSNGKDNSVSVIDLSTLKETARIPAGQNPDAILFEPSTKRVFAFNGRDGTVTVIEAVTNAVAGKIDIGGKLEFAATDGKGMVYDNVEDRDEVVALDARTMTVSHRWAMAGCDSPSGLAIDAIDHRLFAACDNKKLAVVDSLSGKLVAMPAIGAGPDAAVFDATSATAITSNGEDGSLSFLHEDTPDKFTALAPVRTEIGARTMALDPGSHRLYLVTAKFGPAPAPTADTPHPRPSIVPGSVVLLVYEPQ